MYGMKHKHQVKRKVMPAQTLEDTKVSHLSIIRSIYQEDLLSCIARMITNVRHAPLTTIWTIHWCRSHSKVGNCGRPLEVLRLAGLHHWLTLAGLHHWLTLAGLHHWLTLAGLHHRLTLAWPLLCVCHMRLLWLLWLRIRHLGLVLVVTVDLLRWLRNLRGICRERWRW